MKFGLDIRIATEDKSVPLSDLSKNFELAKTLLANPERVEGALLPIVGGKAAMQEYSDPLVPLIEQWLLKLPWLLGGDTEIIPLKNSEHSFGFEPVSDVLDLSCYIGEKNEVDDYVLEPVQVPLENFCESSIGAAKQFIALIDKVDPAFADKVVDVKTLKEACIEAERALKNYRLQR
jgi:hypothetical protein